jgi:hypothetical protein
VDATHKRLQIQMEASKQRQYDFGREIFEFRKIVRLWGKLEGNEIELVTLTNQPMQAHFVDFFDTCEANKLNFYKAYMKETSIKIAGCYPFPHGSDKFKTSVEDYKRAIKNKIKSFPQSYQSFYTKEVNACDNVEELMHIDSAILEEQRVLDAVALHDQISVD